jgi:hypothetical protein
MRDDSIEHPINLEPCSVRRLVLTRINVYALSSVSTACSVVTPREVGRALCAVREELHVTLRPENISPFASTVEETM